MCWIEFIKENWQYIVPIIGFLSAIFMYVVHDRKLKCLQIKQLNEELQKKSQAEIKCNGYSYKGNSIIKIVNAGPANAYNVRVEIIDKDKLEGLIFYHDNWGPYELINATNSIEERVALCCGYTEYIKLKVIGDDDFQKNRETIVNVQL